MPTEPTLPVAESDPRFPSGRWVGYFLMPHSGKRRYPTELLLSFAEQQIRGEGRDVVGKFHISGQYSLADGRCHWNKRYVGKHDVAYQGYNEGKGIWGTWEIANPGGPPWKDGFYIWPEAMGDPTLPSDKAEADLPIEPEPFLDELELVPAGAGLAPG